MSWNKLELHNKELFGPNLNVIEKDGIFQFQIVGQRKYVQISNDEAHRLQRWITERQTLNTAKRVSDSWAKAFDKCNGSR